MKDRNRRCGVDCGLITSGFQSERIIWQSDTVIKILLFPQIKLLHNPCLVRWFNFQIRYTSFGKALLNLIGISLCS